MLRNEVRRHGLSARISRALCG